MTPEELHALAEEAAKQELAAISGAFLWRNVVVGAARRALAKLQRQHEAEIKELRSQLTDAISEARGLDALNDGLIAQRDAAVAEALERAAQIAHENADFAGAAAIRSLKPRSESPIGHDEAQARIAECVREIEILCDSFGYDPAEWLVAAYEDKS